MKILDASSCNTSLPFLSFTISLIRPRLCSQRKNENYEHTPSRLKFLTIFTNREPEFDNYSSNLLVRTSFLPAYLATAYTVGVNFIHKFNLLKSFSIAFVVFFAAESLNVYMYAFELLPRETMLKTLGVCCVPFTREEQSFSKSPQNLPSKKDFLLSVKCLLILQSPKERHVRHFL